MCAELCVILRVSLCEGSALVPARQVRGSAWSEKSRADYKVVFTCGAPPRLLCTARGAYPCRAFPTATVATVALLAAHAQAAAGEHTNVCKLCK